MEPELWRAIYTKLQLVTGAEKYWAGQSFFLYFNIFIGEQLLYSAVLVSL